MDAHRDGDQCLLRSNAFSATFNLVCSDPPAIGQPGPGSPQDKVRDRSTRCWLSTYRERGSRCVSTEPEHVPTLQPAPGDGGRRRHRGDPAASGADTVSALRGVWLPSSRSSGRRRLCHRVCMLQETENRKIEGLVSGFLVEFQFSATQQFIKSNEEGTCFFWLRQFHRTNPLL